MNAPYILWSKRVHSIYGAFWISCQWISDCIPWVQVPISLPMNLRLHPMSSYSLHSESQTAFPMSSYLPTNESQDSECIPWAPIPLPMDSISECIPMEITHPKILESFGWVPPMSYHPDSGMPIESPRMRPERDFRGTPIHTTWVPLKSRRERFMNSYIRIAFCG